MPTSSQATSRFYFDSQAHNHNHKGDDAQAPSPFSSADFDAKPTQIFTSVLRRFFQTISNVKRRRYEGRQSAALDRAVLWGRLPKRKRELQSPIYFAFSNFLRFCETKAVVYFAFSFFVAMRGIETAAILTNRSTRGP